MIVQKTSPRTYVLPPLWGRIKVGGLTLRTPTQPLPHQGGGKCGWRQSPPRKHSAHFGLLALQTDLPCLMRLI